MTEDRRRSLRLALEEIDPEYDPIAKMVWANVSEAGYHTTLKSGRVHPTNQSLAYAVGLLDSGEADRLKRAVDILETVISLQDQNPESKTYGIWSWYLEEPLERMSPPDWNWADFCGVQLLAVWVDHRDRLPEALEGRLRESIVHAARSIERRNVAMDYTNIAIMGTYVTLVAAERFEIPDLLEYAKNRLRRFHRHVMDQGSFTEYNSPTYTTVAIRELSRMVMHFQDSEDRKLAAEICDLAWKHVARHFHPPTRQWAGPHSRTYQTDLRDRPSYPAFLEMATGRQGYFLTADPLPVGLDTYRLPIECPKEYVPFFASLTEPREVVETFAKADPRREGQKKAVVGTTYLHPNFTLGTVNRGMFWRQRRSFLAYWGTAEKPTYLHPRFLHDGYDYCSALPFSAQSEGFALAALVFATDGGDTHPNLDLVKEATIRANDLRLRFEFGADLDGLRIVEPFNPNGGITIADREVTILLKPLEDRFGGDRFRWEAGGNGETRWVDAVAYSGEVREVDFSALEEAFLIFALQVVPKGQDPIPFDSAKAVRNGSGVRGEWMLKTGVLRVEVPSKPSPFNYLNDTTVVNAPSVS